MMKPFILFGLLLLLLSFGCSSYKGKHVSFFDEGEKEVKSSYASVVSKSSDGRYILRTFNPDKKQVNSLITCSSKACEKYDGPMRSWDDSGNILVDGNFKNGLKEGLFREVLPSRRKYIKETTYKSGIPIGSQKILDSNGVKLYELKFENGRPVNKWHISDSIRLKSLESNSPLVYENFDKLIFSNLKEPHLASVNSENILQTKIALRKFFRKEFHAPAEVKKNKITRFVSFYFIVNEDGTISDVQILNGLTDNVEQEFRSVLKKMPKWKPGTIGGIPIKMSFFSVFFVGWEQVDTFIPY